MSDWIHEVGQYPVSQISLFYFYLINVWPVLCSSVNDVCFFCVAGSLFVLDGTDSEFPFPCEILDILFYCSSYLSTLHFLSLNLLFFEFLYLPVLFAFCCVLHFLHISSGIWFVAHGLTAIVQICGYWYTLECDAFQWILKKCDSDRSANDVFMNYYRHNWTGRISQIISRSDGWS